VLDARGEDESVDEALPLESVEPPYLGRVRVRVRARDRVRVRIRVTV